MDAILLSRIQFAANITFHILYPTISISLGWILLFFKYRYNKTNLKKWMDAYKFWVKVFALCFALGVVSGVTMSFQFGTNWPGFMLTVGNIAGPLLGYEVLTAFFLEATFLGIMLFGTDRVSVKTHTLATFLVAFGTTLSAFWILALNSWMQTPTGFEMKDGVAHVTSWLEILFNPSMPYKFSHMLIASMLTTGFLITGISSYRYLRGDKAQSVIASLKTGIYISAILIPIQIFVGDLHGLNTLKHQPAKIAAMEGLWQTEKGAKMLFFAIPDEKERKNHFEIGIPKGASFLLTHDLDGEVKGIEEFGDKHPPVFPVFFAFRIMVGTGLLMLLSSWIGAWQMIRYKFLSNVMAKIFVYMSFSGWVATVAGWYVTEIGRQPYLVYNLLMTRDAVANNVEASHIGFTLSFYISLYLILIIAFISVIFYMARHAGQQDIGLNESAFSSRKLAGSMIEED